MITFQNWCTECEYVNDDSLAAFMKEVANSNVMSDGVFGWLDLQTYIRETNARGDKKATAERAWTYFWDLEVHPNAIYFACAEALSVTDLSRQMIECAELYGTGLMATADGMPIFAFPGMSAEHVVRQFKSMPRPAWRANA